VTWKTTSRPDGPIPLVSFRIAWFSGSLLNTFPFLDRFGLSREWWGEWIGWKGWKSIITSTASYHGSLAYIYIQSVWDDELVSAFAYVM
jgi:hypothetical protein